MLEIIGRGPEAEMSDADKLLERMHRNPRGDWRINDVERLCWNNGLECEPPRGGGSHYKVSDPHGSFSLTVPARRPIKPVYIRALVGFILQKKDKSRA
jgi:hypothetical protein